MTGTTNTQFAVGVHALVLLSVASGGRLSSDDIAASAGANPVYVRRVLGRLREAGLVASRPGVGGGWELVRPADEVRLGDVWRVIAGDEPGLLGVHEAAPGCVAGQRIQRGLEEIEGRAARAVEAELDRVTIAALVPDVRLDDLRAALSAPRGA